MTKRNIVHIEISASDLDASAKFYKELFGWKMTPMPEMNYMIFDPGVSPGGGFTPVSEEYPAGTVLIYIASDDIEVDLARVNSLGGKVLRSRTEIPGVGWFGIFNDPVGNRIALYTSADPEFNQ